MKKLKKEIVEKEIERIKGETGIEVKGISFAKDQKVENRDEILVWFRKKGSEQNYNTLIKTKELCKLAGIDWARKITFDEKKGVFILE